MKIAKIETLKYWVDWRNWMFVKGWYESELRNTVSTHPAPISGGHFDLPAGPGIGTDLHPEVLEEAGEQYRYRPQPVSGRTVPPHY